MRVFDNEISPIKFIFLYLTGLLILYLGYLCYPLIFNFSDKWKHTYSTGGELLLIISYPFALIILLAAVVIFFIMLYYTLFYLAVFLKNLPQIVSKEIAIIKRIWANKGFGKYAVFGGIGFYLKLRSRVFAFVLAFISLSIITWFFAFKQHTYEKAYWKINFYYQEPLPEFKFKPNIPYTIKSDVDFYGILINGRRYVTGQNTSWAEDAPNKIALTLPKHWNVTFPDTTIIEFMFYEDYISQIFSMTLEVWENKQEGRTIYPQQFSYVTNKVIKSPDPKKLKKKK